MSDTSGTRASPASLPLDAATSAPAYPDHSLLATLRDELAPLWASADAQASWRGLGMTIVASAVLVLLLKGIGRIDGFAERALERLGRGRQSALKIQGLELLSIERLTSLAAQAVGWLRRVVSLLLIIVYANAVLGFFPWTQGASRQFFVAVLELLWNTGLAIVGYIPNLLSILVIVLITNGALSIGQRIFQALGAGTLKIRGFYPDWAKPTYQLVRAMALVLAAIAVFPYLPGAGSPAFQGVSIFVGVLLSLGSSSAVSHVMAGVVLVYMRPFTIGDRVRIADTLGDVIDKNLLSVRLRTPMNVELVLPNATVLASRIENFSVAAAGPGLIVGCSVTVGYDIDWRRVHALLLQAASRTAHLLQTPAPFVWQTKHGDFSVLYQLNCYTTKAPLMLDIESELRRHVLDAFHEARVEIMSPQQVAVRSTGPSLPPEQAAASV